MATLNTHVAIPPPSQAQLDRGYGASSTSRNQIDITTSAADFGSTPGHPTELSPLAVQQSSGRFNEEWDASQRGSSIADGLMQRSNSIMSQGETLTPSRGGTLKKKASLRRQGSLKRSSSRRSSRAGSVRSLALQPGGEVDEAHSAFYSPVPTSGNPTEILATRFQAWRKVLKDLITYFREIQTSYDHRAKNLLKISNVINNTSPPTIFMQSGGIDDAMQILRTYHKSAIAEANKSRDIENDVILALVGLRSDLSQKIKEIKSLSGDFKNSVDKEMDATRKAVNNFQDGLGQADADPSQVTGKQDPYLLKLVVDRQVEKQIDEENYLHQAYLNLEASGRELESIVVGEIQKSYNAYAGILKREADGSYNTVEELRAGPIAMPKDHEWDHFVENDEHFIDPRIPVREPQNIHYPGKDNYLAQVIREGLLERKSKYLKSYTAGWYVLSPTHLHEFKSADKTQAPIMSLYLPEQKLGSRSNEGASSNKFMLKGRQTGALHRGHSWVFRAESFETMEMWYIDIKNLTEKSPQERNAFVRQHARSVSGTSQRAGSISSDGNLDEEDEEPFSAAASAVVVADQRQDSLPRRPQPGGRFPSDIQVNTQRGLQDPLSPSSGSSNFGDNQDYVVVAAAGSLPDGGVGQNYVKAPTSPSHAQQVNKEALQDGVNPYTYQPIDNTANEHTDHGLPLTTVARPGCATGVPEAFHNRDQQPSRLSKEELGQQEDCTALEFPKIVAPDMEELSGQQAALEAVTLATQDTYAHQSEQAAREPVIIGALNSPPTLVSPGSKVIPGGRHQGDLTNIADVSNGQLPETSPNLAQKILNPLAEDLARPSLATSQNHRSVLSVSQLHVPGEFPKTTTESRINGMV
ncbi:hypothetical protein BGZ60DRAFT_381241 [Tricladium varicosporioides]|nr:hypothetical protein BGZ60DRAFT_381241 [Hymenoscyphus varicosporioides]